MSGLPCLEAGVPVLAVLGGAGGGAGADLVHDRGVGVEHLLGVGAQGFLQTLEGLGA